MNILFDHQIFCLQQYGGISRYFYELASHIADPVEQKVKIFAPVHINSYLSVLSNVSHKGVQIPVLSGFGRVAAFGVDTALAYAMIKSRRGVDIFHETYYSGMDCCPRSAKRVITVFDMIHEKYAVLSPGRDKTRQVKANAVKRADHVICISENTKCDLIKLLGVPEEKISVTYLGCSLVAKEKRASSSGGKPYILYVGKRDGYKNFSSMLRAYAASPMLKNNFSLVSFGGGVFSLRERELIKEYGLLQTSVLHFSGGDDVLAGLYKAAAAFVYPSLYEGFGIPALEAMSFGCPIVCANNSSLPEVVGNAAELFDPEDEAEMRAAIERVVSSSERSRILSDRGYGRLKQFSWKKCAQDTLNIYSKVLQC
ncbi:MAG: glycosyltransferase family 1 protein [Elusimicrobiota bacterium]